MKALKRNIDTWGAIGIFAAVLTLVMLLAGLLARTVRADPSPGYQPVLVQAISLASIPWEAWFVGGLAALAGLETALRGLAMAVRAFSKLTKTTADDHIADDLEAADAKLVEGLNILRGMRLSPTPPSVTPLAMLAVLLLGVGSMGLSSCATVREQGAAGVAAFLDCEAADIPPTMLHDATDLATAAVRNAIAGDGSIDASQLKADAAVLKSDLGKCALAGAIAALATPVPVTPGGPAAAPLEVNGKALRGAFAKARSELGWAPVRLAGGETL
jgi:hypothetical protein